ncbi:MAG: hypothetical protein L0Z07_04660 [Planctomycetes bacterium]|nr:hypothetical protein [Planctomycetota bacterium]
MIVAIQQDALSLSCSHLPGWWRRLLIALAILVLCSCRGPTLPNGSEAQLAATIAPLLASQVTAEADAAIKNAATEAAPTQPPVADDTENKAAQDNAASPAKEPPDLGTTRELLQPTLAAEDIPLPVVIPPVGVMSDQRADVLPGSYPGKGCAACNIPSDPTYQCDSRVIGPSDEYLCDGGDFGSPAGVKANWKVEGVEQEDAIAHYDTLDGRVMVTPSNRVCIYAPRFGAVRRVVNAMAHERNQFIEVALEEETPVRADESQPVASSLQRHAVAINLGERPSSLFRQRQQAGGLENLQATMDAYTLLAAYSNLHIIRTGLVENAEKARLTQSIDSAITWTGNEAAQVVLDTRMAVAMVGVRQAGVVYQTDGPDSPRLRLIKLASRSHALPGEDVEFTLRYDNVGDQLIGNATIVDNLTTRLEYVPKSAQSSVEATFITAPNTGGSTILRWEIRDPVKPGEGGILRFRAKVL